MTTTQTTEPTLSTFAAICGFTSTGYVGDAIFDAFLDAHNDALRMGTFEALAERHGVSVDTFVGWWEGIYS